MNKTILVYGTLREGEYNNLRVLEVYGENSMTPLHTVRLPGFRMYQLGDYPAAVRSDNKEDEITCEIFEVTDDAFHFINIIETGAGYSPIKVEGSTIYVFNTILNENLRIKSGDWTKRND